MIVTINYPTDTSNNAGNDNENINVDSHLSNLLTCYT